MMNIDSIGKSMLIVESWVHNTSSLKGLLVKEQNDGFIEGREMGRIYEQEIPVLKKILTSFQNRIDLQNDLVK